MMEENNSKSKKSKFGWYILSFFLGCLAMYALIYFLPYEATQEITKNIKEVKITEENTGIADAVEKIYDAVVVVSTYKDDTYYASGTGFLYKQDGNKYYILTNNHVVEDGTNVTVTFTNNDVIETTIVGADKYSDVAVLSFKSDNDYTLAEIGSSTEARIGDTAFAVGAPLDSAYSWTVTRGILSGKDRMVEVSLNGDNSDNYIMKVLQTDATINSGNSGGALCNAKGEVIGITSLKLVSDGVEGMGFAIPIEDAVEMAEKLINGEEIEYPYLGVSMYDLSQIYYSSYRSLIEDYGSTNGVFVRSVEKDSAAYEAGIKANDIISKIDGNEVKNSAYLKYYLYQYSVGDTVKITVFRDGNTKEISVKLGANKQTT